MQVDLPAGLTLRRANSADAEPVKRLVYTVLREYGMKPEPGHAEKGLDYIDNAFSGGGLWLLCADEPSECLGHDRLIGTVGLIRQDDTICELTKMFLAPGARGKGLGRLLLLFVMEQAKSLGYRRMHLESDTSLKEAVALYRSAGFEIDPRENSVARCNLVMTRAL